MTTNNGGPGGLTPELDEQFDLWSMQANKKFSLSEVYWITHDAVRTLPHFLKFRRNHGEQWTSRIMLAVTEVNGCAMCAFAHTKFALEVGMDQSEVRHLLGGVTEGAPDNELGAIGFAQHYADTGAHPEKHTWQRLVSVYGLNQALGVLGATRVMMWGNAVGIPLSALRARIKDDPHPNSSLGSEIGSILTSWGVLPVALVRAGLSTIVRRPLIAFTEGSDPAKVDHS